METSVNQANKKLVWEFWQALHKTDAAGVKELAASVMTDDLRWHGPDPINDLRGVAAFAEQFWLPLTRAFSGLERRTHIFCGGRSNGRRDGDAGGDGKMWVSGTGILRGVFVDDYLGIPATGAGVGIRWGEFYRLEDQKIVTAYCLLDLVDLMRQAGYQVLPPALGAEDDYPPPQAADGVMLDAQDEGTSAHTLDHIWRFIFAALDKYDGAELGSMGVGDFFHPRVKWFGPGGIGACYSHKEFEDYHQIPWLRAFPDRRVQDLDSLFAEGNYSAGCGWAGVKATHTGEYKGAPATGNALEFNGLDWWKREGDKIIENWVFVDMLHLFRQFGVDLLGRLNDMRK